MRYKLVNCVTLLLIATPMLSSGQQEPPKPKNLALIVETLDPSPSTIKSGEPFRVTYEVSYLDLSERGMEVVIFDDRIRPENLSVAPFEADNLTISKEFSYNNVLVRYYTYTFRIINPKKGNLALPGFNLSWAVKKAGTDIKDLKVETFLTDEVPINYVTTITPHDPYLDIRDTWNFEDYGFKSRVLYWSGLIISIALTLAWAWIVFLLVRSDKKKVVIANKDKDKYKPGSSEVYVKKDSRWSAIRKIRKITKLMKSSQYLTCHEILKIQSDLIVALKEIFRVQFNEIGTDNTPGEILSYVLKSDKYKYGAYVELAYLMVKYQENVWAGRDVNGIISSLNLSDHANKINRLLWKTNVFVRAYLWTKSLLPIRIFKKRRKGKQ